MISEADFENLRTYIRDRNIMMWSLVVSVPLTLLLWMLLTWRLLMHLAGVGAHKTPEVFMVSSSSLRIEHRQQPLPEQPHQQPQPPAHTQPRPAAAPKRAPVPVPRSQPTELARNVPKAPPQPPSSNRRTHQATLAERLAQQEVAFSREAQQINADHAPLSIATANPAIHDAAEQQYHMNFSGDRELQGRGEGYLDALRRWTDGGMHCYYGRYYWTYPTGGMEVADIPWAFCFPPNADPIARGVHEFPFPLPLTGYRVPPGTQLQPIEAEVYKYWLSTQ